MSPLNLLEAHRIRSFPRVSGDEPAGAELLWNGIQFSPRERG